MVQVVEYLVHQCRLGAATDRKGGCFLPDGMEWGDVKLFYDANPDGAEHFVVEMMGAGVRLATQHVRFEWLLRYVLGCGCRITRLDVAIDLYGRNQRIIERCIESCQRGEQVHFRTWRRIESGAKGDEVARTVNLGARGKDGSGRFGRFYDKGLESGQAKAGRWVRYEVEFSDACAHSVADRWAHGTIKDAVACALGAFDFRRAPRNAGEKANASRRPQVGWWAEFIGSCAAVLVRAKAREKTLYGYVGWVKKAVLPGVVTYAKVVGLSVEDFLRYVVDEPVQFCARKASSQVGREFRAHFEQVVPI